jgi:hypothetical protein
MHKSQHRNLNIANQGNVSPPDSCHNSIFEYKDNELADMSERELRGTLKNHQ